MNKKIASFLITAAVGMTFAGQRLINEECIKTYAVSVSDNSKTENKNYRSPDHKCYEMKENSGFIVSEDYSVDFFAYGNTSIGKFKLNGNFGADSKHNGYNAYTASGDVKFSYVFDSTYKTDNKNSWNLCDSSEKSVDGINTKNIKNGAIVVQKSSTGNSNDWKNVKTINDSFDKDILDLSEFYTIKEADIKKGVYYRIYVAYEMTQRVKENDWYKPDDYTNKEFVELYEFYLGYSQNPVQLTDILSGENITGNRTVEDGFVINKSGTDFKVSVKKDENEIKEVNDKTSFYAPGEYVIDIVSELNEKYQYKIKVNKGFTTALLNSIKYEGNEKEKYDDEKMNLSKYQSKDNSLSELYLCHRYGEEIGAGQKRNIDAYGIKGDKVCLLMNIKSPSSENKYCADNYGKDGKEKVNGAKVGIVNTGALLIQTSLDGINWENADESQYSNGLFTTDFSKYYADNGDVMIYLPDGKDIANGMYLKVTYAYELKNKNTDKKTRHMEVYNFYLCSNDLDAVTFHNLSVTDNLSEIIGADKDVNVELFQKTESLKSGSETVTGFEIDTDLNKSLRYDISLNGSKIENPLSKKYTESGRYDITVRSAVGDEKTVTIFVDTDDSSESIKRYFGDGFIKGKRIYSEGKYPVYEGGKTSYEINATDGTRPLIGGVIRNTTTGTEIRLPLLNTMRSGVLTEPGHYVAELSNRQKISGEELPGDYRVFTFEFDIIAEGTSPGPVVNERNLRDHCKLNISDSYPMYYGVTYQSASKGTITMAFATREAAKNFAYNYEKGTVEKQSDGSFRYKGVFEIARKIKYNNLWDLTDAADYFADMAVHEGYFDLSDQFTYLTLDEKQLSENDNLRTLELEKSITVFAENEKEKLCTNDALPLISPKKYSYLSNMNSGKVNTGFNDFEFIQDKYNCDSYKVVITDSSGKKYPVKYDEGVGEQLEKADCPSGIVTIEEQNIYGDKTVYNAMYIAKNENLSELTISYYQDGKQETQTFTQNDDGKSITVQEFDIKSLVDNTDPYSMVVVSNSANTYYNLADHVSSKQYIDNGEYTVKVVNRLGYSYTINIIISGSDFASINFSDNENDEEKIMTSFGANNIVLPHLERFGYNHIGYKDEDGNDYPLAIEQIMFRGTKTLEAVWKAKQFQLVMVDEDGNSLGNETIEFGKEIKLQEPENREGYAFGGWKDGEILIEDSYFTLDKESDVVLTAYYLSNSVKHETEAALEESEEESSNKINRTPFIAVPFVLLVVMMVFVLGKNKSKSKEKNNTNESGEDEK